MIFFSHILTTLPLPYPPSPTTPTPVPSRQLSAASRPLLILGKSISLSPKQHSSTGVLPSRGPSWAPHAPPSCPRGADIPSLRVVPLAWLLVRSQHLLLRPLLQQVGPLASPLCGHPTFVISRHWHLPSSLLLTCLLPPLPYPVLLC